MPRTRTQQTPLKRTFEDRWPFISKVVLFFGGLGGAAFEITANQTERPTVLLFLAACMGVPAFFPGRNGKEK